MKKIKPAKPAIVTPGMTYQRPGGGLFRCISIEAHGGVVLRSVMSGYIFTAYGVIVDSDDMINWQTISDGHYEKEERA